jgi:hypothetical protein
MAVQCPLPQSLLLLYHESTPMTKHRVGLLEDRVILDPSHSRNISNLVVNSIVYIQETYSEVTFPYTKHLSSSQTFFEQSCKLQYFLFHFFTVLAITGPNSLLLSWPLLELSLPYRGQIPSVDLFQRRLISDR